MYWMVVVRGCLVRMPRIYMSWVSEMGAIVDSELDGWDILAIEIFEVLLRQGFAGGRAVDDGTGNWLVGERC